MFLAKMSINRPIMTTMGILIFIIFGGISYYNMNLEQMPDIEIPFVTISTIYPGAGPKEIEMQVTKKIEDVISTVSQIEKIESYSLDGISIIIMEFQLDKDVNVANQEVKDKIEEILNDLPDDAEKPIIQKVDFKAFPIIDIVLSGELDSRELYEIADKTLKDRFSQIEGVAKVNVSGGQKREIRVNLDNRVVFENSISLPQLVQVLKAHNMNIPGGYFDIDDQEYTVRFDGEFNDLETINELQVPTPYGNKKVRQIAEVVDGGNLIRERAIYFNNIQKLRDPNVVKLGIIKSSEGNVVKVAEQVIATIPEIEALLPAGARLEMINDQSVFTRSTVQDTMTNILLGVLITSFILLLFLHDLRATLIVALSMPTSIISTFLLMSLFDMSLNMMSLMGLSVSVGVLVANSVVVIENIFRHKALGKSPKQAAYKGTSEVTVAVLAATMTNIVVFLPIANMSSMVGRFLVELALAASFATIFSLIMSYTLTPMLASVLLPAEAKKNRLALALEKMEHFFEKFYSRMLNSTLKNKWRSFGVIAFAGLMFVAVVGIFGSKLGAEFMPVLDDGGIRITVELPSGYNLDETAKVMNEIENRVKEFDEVEHIITTLGRLSELDIGTNMASMEVRLCDANERNIGITDMVSKWIVELADIPNAIIKIDITNQQGPGASPIEFFLLGQDLEKLEKYKEVVIDKLKDIPGLINFDNSSRAGKPEITVTPNRMMLAETGLTSMDLALTLRASMEGIVSSKYREFGHEYDIVVTLNDESTDTPEKISNIPIVSPFGTYRLSQVADITFTTGYTKILHRDKFTSIQFTGSNSSEVPLGNITSEIDRRLNEIELESGYYLRWGGSTKMMNDMFADMIFAFLLAIILTYMLLAALLESFLQPFFILLTLPLALIGVIFSLYITDISLGITSLMAIIMLIGIVVNNAILILDYTNVLIREKGLAVKDALVKACPVKLKPIIMSTAAIVLGMLPMALGIGSAGREMRIPLGVVSIGGLIVSTALTLFVIPAFYYLASKMKKKGNVVVEEV